MRLKGLLSWLFIGMILLGVALVAAALLEQRRTINAPAIAVVTSTSTATATPEAWLLPFPTKTTTPGSSEPRPAATASAAPRTCADKDTTPNQHATSDRDIAPQLTRLVLRAHRVRPHRLRQRERRSR
ncbi:MAG: hypothetical protein R3E31_07440 [Chloroflexota bacterium]